MAALLSMACASSAQTATSVTPAPAQTLRCQGLESYDIQKNGGSGSIKMRDSGSETRFTAGDVKPAVPEEGREGLQWVKHESIANGRRLSYGLDNSTKPATVQATITPGREGEGPVLNLITDAKARWSMDELLFVARTYAGAKCETVKP
ncbi:MAG: hypothetical protein ABI837_01820 [Acidobacteriota bacterium]